MEKNDIPLAIKNILNIFKKIDKKYSKSSYLNIPSKQPQNQPIKQEPKPFVFNDATYFDMDSDESDFY